MLVSTLFNICAFIINANGFREACLNTSVIDTTSQSCCCSETTTGPFSACTYSSDILQVEDSYSSIVMSDVNPSPEQQRLWLVVSIALGFKQASGKPFALIMNAQMLNNVETSIKTASYILNYDNSRKCWWNIIPL